MGRLSRRGRGRLSTPHTPLCRLGTFNGAMRAGRTLLRGAECLRNPARVGSTPRAPEAERSSSASSDKGGIPKLVPEWLALHPVPLQLTGLQTWRRTTAAVKMIAPALPARLKAGGDSECEPDSRGLTPRVSPWSRNEISRHATTRTGAPLQTTALRATRRPMTMQAKEGD